MDWWRALAPTARPTSADRDEASTEAPNPSGIRVLAIEESIDLHCFAPRDIPSVVHEYLREARRAGLREVRVIHGIGKGVQRRRVQILLAKHPHVAAFRSDGLGSTLVELSVREKSPRPL